MPRHSHLQQCRADQHCAARSPCDSRQGDLLTILHARERRGVAAERRCLPIAPVMGRGIMTKTAAPAYSAGDGQSTTCAHPHYRLQDLQDPPTEEKGGATLRISPSLFFSFFFSSLSLSLSLPLSRLPLIFPLVYKREGWAPYLGILFWPMTQKHITTLRGTSTPLHLH
jgi:hypothetical protein